MKKRKPAWFPPDYTHGIVLAIKALSEGKATEDQQKKALAWIIEHASQRWEIPFYSDADGGDRESAFASGRMFVGQQIIKLVNMPPKLVAQLRKETPNG